MTMKLRTLCIFAGCVFALAACATAPKQWSREGATQQDFYMDQGQCKAQAFGVFGGSLLQIALVFNSCMQGKGWSQVAAVLPPSDPTAACMKLGPVDGEKCLARNRDAIP